MPFFLMGSPMIGRSQLQLIQRRQRLLMQCKVSLANRLHVEQLGRIPTASSQLLTNLIERASKVLRLNASFDGC